MSSAEYSLKLIMHRQHNAVIAIAHRFSNRANLKVGECLVDIDFSSELGQLSTTPERRSGQFSLKVRPIEDPSI